MQGKRYTVAVDGLEQPAPAKPGKGPKPGKGNGKGQGDQGD